MALQPTDLLLINRGGVNYKVPYSTVLAGPTGQAGAIQSSDLLMVQSDAVLYQVSVSSLRSFASTTHLNETDFMLVERDNVQYAYQPQQVIGLVPEISLSINPALVASDTTTALTVNVNNASPYGSVPPQLRLPDGTIYYFGTGFDSIQIKKADIGVGGTARIFGQFTGISFSGSRAMQTLSVDSAATWSAMLPNPLATFGGTMFFNCENLTSVPTSIPVRSCARMFSGAKAFNQSDISDLEVSSVENFSLMFDGALAFNQSLNSWDVSSATNMSYMFRNSNFNRNINSWGPNVVNVTNMTGMFQGLDDYNQPMDTWNVSSVATMDNMFNNAASFSQDLTGWCVSQFASEPTGFSEGSGLNSAQLPVWGTCP